MRERIRALCDPYYIIGTLLIASALVEYIWFPGTFRKAIQLPAAYVSEIIIQIPNWYEVHKIPDGDSLVIRYYGRLESIQLRNVVTPLRNRPGYEEAQQAFRELIGDSRVSLEFEHEEIERDFFGRFIPYVIVGGKNLNIEMVRLGHSEYESEPDKSRYETDFLAAEEEARQNQRGIWAIRETDAETTSSGTSAEETRTLPAYP